MVLRLFVGTYKPFFFVDEKINRICVKPSEPLNLQEVVHIYKDYV